MGDYSTPKRRDVFDRLRRRIEVYRRHQSNCLGRFDHAYENPTNGIYHQQHQDTLSYQQRWLENKAKKASKSSKSANKDTSNSVNHGDTHRNLSLVTQKLKKKIDNNQQSENQPSLDKNPFDFDDSDSTTTKTVSGPSGLGVSVHIVQKINTGGNSSQEQNITNVKVNTTVETHYASEGSNKAHASTNVETNFKCKPEPGDTHDSTQCSGSNIADNNQSTDSENISIDQDELDDILTSIQKDESGEFSDEINLLEELRKFEQIYNKFSEQDGNDPKMFAGMTSTSPGLQKPGSAGPYDPNSANIFDNNQNAAPVRSPPVTGYRSATQSAHHVPQAGPAAETLKQMAAQHQHQQQHDPYGADPYASARISSESHYRQNGYSQNYDQATQQQHSYPSQNSAYIGQQNVNSMRPASMQFGQKSPDMGLGYTGTKPLTHYPNSQGNPPISTPSSLQQLQNQVQSHFNQNPAMEITQTQHMQVTDGSHRMQMSQTQQLQMRQPPHQISMTQQQSFSMSGGMGANQSTQYMTDEMKMQMMQENLRREQQRTMMERQQQAHAQAQAAQMQAQYMSRPPPEYKTQHSVPEGYSNSSVGSNPLQTMQNMVNQTSNLPSQGYGQIKTESADVQMQNGMMQSSQMAAMQRMSAGSGNSSEATVTGMAQGAAVHTAVGNFPGQQIQRQQSYPGAQLSAPLTRPQRPSGPTYTSAIMRNQRPPNVNVGPDGLNISQPRSQQHEWPRQMMPQSQGTRMAMAGQMAPPVMNGTQMSAMQYNSYNNQAAAGASMQMRPSRPPMQMNSMQSQAAMMQGNAQAQQMMMQQQNMQMSQRMGARAPMQQGQAAQYGMTAPVETNSGYPSQGGGQQDDFMNLLDSAAQNGPSSEFMTVQNSGGSDANWLEDILGGK